MRRSDLLSLVVLFCQDVVGYLPTVPSAPFVQSEEGTYDLRAVASIVVDSKYSSSRSEEGETLIPPTLFDFGEVFREDLVSSLNISTLIKEGSKAVPNSIFMTIDPDPNTKFLDAAGRSTAEGYTIEINGTGIIVSGASPLGAWWATRTVLQAAVLNDNILSYGVVVDAPGWASRGAMLDCGRHYYPPEFIIEMCSYLSFFKQNEFHLHLSDNLFVNRELYTSDQISSLYKRFRLWSENPSLSGLNEFPDESYTNTDFDAIQQACARRGVTIIPEIEAPAHALVIAHWKPELALSDDPTMLNISHPDTMPTLKTIWQEFLPWFHSKSVHIGADEYSANHTLDYVRLVSELNTLISESGKQTRIWGTFTPSQGVSVPKDVAIQHWAPYEDNPLFDYIENGYSVINSDFSFYIVSKWSGYFPQRLNKHLIFNGNPLGGAYAPHIFDTSNSTNNAPRDNALVLGHITAQWSDYGPLASTFLEAYHAWRNELPAMADKQWGGQLLETEYDLAIERLIATAPGQNLDRRCDSLSPIILSYQFVQDGSCYPEICDSSGNNYHALSRGCEFDNSTLYLSGDCFVETPLNSKGRNYTLSFSVNPSAPSGTLFSGPDSTLLAGSGADANVTLLTSGVTLSLNYSLPVGRWTNISLSGIGDATYLSFSESHGRAGQVEFLTKFEPNGVPGSNGVMTVWAPVAVEAPLKRIGEGFKGMMKNITLLGV